MRYKCKVVPALNYFKSHATKTYEADIGSSWRSVVSFKHQRFCRRKTDPCILGQEAE
jgi:hypothetical protein